MFAELRAQKPKDAEKRPRSSGSQTSPFFTEQETMKQQRTFFFARETFRKWLRTPERLILLEFLYFRSTKKGGETPPPERKGTPDVRFEAEKETEPQMGRCA